MRGELHDGDLRLVGASRAGYTFLAASRTGLWSLMDWPELTALGRARFLVQNRTDDELFPRAGMEQAHDHLKSLHEGNDRYRGSFSAGDHAFDAAMQEEAWAFLSEAL